MSTTTTATAPADAVPAKTPTADGGGEDMEVTTSSLFDVSLLLSIAQQGGAGGSSGNVCVSPFLVEALLALLYLSAGGSTATELRQHLRLQRFPSNADMAKRYALHLTLTTNPASETNMAVRSRILLPPRHTAGEELRHIAHKYFSTHIDQAGDGADALNSWLVERCGLSSDAAAAVEHEESAAATADDAHVLLTAAFKLKWFLPFSAYRTGIYDFHIYNNNNNNNNHNGDNNNSDTQTPGAEIVRPVAMLFDNDMFVKFGEFRELDARAIELPCEHDELELTMLVVLPNRRDGLPALMQQLRHTDLATLTEQRMQMESVQVLLPKFSIDCTSMLRNALQELGITLIFHKLANLKHLASATAADATAPLKFANIWHTATLQVNESGSEPSSVTAPIKPIAISNSLNAKQKFFRADHPFYFAIRAGDVTYFAGLLNHCGGA